MSDTDNRTTNDAETGAPSSGIKHRKIKGAAEVVHGIGDTVRGRMMSAVDSGTKTGGTHPEVEKGRREVEQGMAKLTGGPGVTGTAPNAAQRRGAHDISPARAAQEGGAAPGPVSAMTAGLNAGPDATMAQGLYQRQSAAGAEAPTGSFRRGSNDRDFHPGGEDAPQRPPTIPQQGATPGPAPDRDTLSGNPQRLG